MVLATGFLPGVHSDSDTGGKVVLRCPSDQQVCRRYAAVPGSIRKFAVEEKGCIVSSFF